MDVWKINAANAVNLYGVRNPLTKAVIDDAAVTARLLDSGTEVTGSSFSIPLIDAATGHYGGNSTVLPEGTSAGQLTRGAVYELEIVAEKSSVTIRRDRIEVVAGYAAGA